MADAVDIVATIVEVIFKIKETVDAIGQNRKDCVQIKSRVERVRQTLSLCENNAEMMKNSAVSTAVKALGEALGKALTLVTDCQKETNAVCLCWTAGKLSKQLSKVDQDISNVHLEATLAILVYHISSARRPPRRLPRVSAAGYASIFQAMREKLYALTGCVSGRNAKISGRVSGRNAKMQSPSPHQEPLHGQSFAPAPDGETAAQPRTLLHQIARVAVEIRAAVETVRQNKEDCIEIDRRANRVSALLSQLENTETMKDAAMGGALEKILETFRRACTLVTACQTRSIIIMCLSCPPGKLSNELREVLDQMPLDLDVLIDHLPTLPTARD